MIGHIYLLLFASGPATLVVPVNILVIAAEQRELVIEADLRTVTIAAEPRTLEIDR